MQYVPRPVPHDTKDIPAYLKNELESLSAALVQGDEFLLLRMRYTAPTKPRDGMVVLADGTSWNPGSGAGYYGYRASAWRFLG